MIGKKVSVSKCIVNVANFRKSGKGSAKLSRPSALPQVNTSNGTEVKEAANGASANAEDPYVSTLAIHAGERNDRRRFTDTLTIPIAQTSTYHFKDTQQLLGYLQGTYESYEYGRYGNPTTRTAEMKLAALDHAETCLMSASGMNTATTMLLALVPQGGHIITTTDCYRRTRQFIQTFLPRMGITATVLDPQDYDGLEAALKANKATLYFSESPTNPYLRCIDVPRVVDLCHAHDCLVVVDSTFATPINQQPIKMGADLVIHSVTKYLAGHNDLLAGSIAGRADLVATVKSMQNILGGVVDPHTGYLAIRGMKTLEVRVLKQNQSALEIATRLESHPKVLTVYYPGLESHPDHAIAVKQMNGFGGVITFLVDGDLEATSKFIDSTKIPYMAPSLGGVETLIEQPTIISYWDQTAEARAKVGIKDNMVRFSVGLEDVEDIWADLCQAFDKM